MSAQIFEMVRGSLVELFGLDPARISPQSRLADDLELDSIDAVDLVDHMKHLTGRKIGPEDFRAVHTVADLVQATERLLRS
ncbi:MAG TPA: acyl carrier protein [Steroidobacteraceae bacterium]|nr:acyl carrier protein [Steroidobacteraceae bacterium]